jgi:uncharacterized protein
MDSVRQSALLCMRLAELQALAPRFHALLADYGASNLAVFGSVARYEAGPHSDVDLLVDMPPGVRLFEWADLMVALEDLLQQKVDLIRRRSLKSSLRDRVDAEAVVI